MRKYFLICSVFFSVLFIGQAVDKTEVWGFYAHKLINQHAIYQLPSELVPTFKLHLEELRHFAIAPDQRRHSSPHEAVRHYMDLDHWGELPFDNVPRNYDEAVWKMADILLVLNNSTDTVDVKGESEFDKAFRDSLMSFFHQVIRYDEKGRDIFSIEEVTGVVQISGYLDVVQYDVLVFKNNLDEYGILPYHLLEYQNRLKWAFIERDIERIIRLAGEIGHYIGDAHVPLHTTVNYNGQLTGQDGIHAFWETRIPELFAASEYDFWVEPSKYIDDKETFFWDIVLESHKQVDDVLRIERELKEDFPKDQQYCFDERLGVTQRIECKEFAREYQLRMNGLVEKRMRDAITAIASSWYSAWVDAGSPDLESEKIDFQLPADSLENSRNSELMKQNK